VKLLGLLLALLVFNLPVDLNTATVKDLLELPIGYEDADSIFQELKQKSPDVTIEEILKSYKIPREKAEEIVIYREEYGYFESFFDLLKVPGVKPGDLARWRYLLTLKPREEVSEFSSHIEWVRERSASEESPRENAFDEWITRLSFPIILDKRVTVDELYQLNRVSLIDAAAVVRKARTTGFRGMWDVRRTPGLSHYGYLNLRPFVSVRGGERKLLSGWAHLSIDYTNPLYEPGSELWDRVDQLLYPGTPGDTGVTDTALVNSLYQAGWTEEEVESLSQRLLRMRDEIAELPLIPKVRLKGNLFLERHLRTGFLYQRDAFNRDRPIVKGFIGVEDYGLIDRLYLGNYRITLGEALMMDNTDETRDRLVYRPQGVFGDLTSTKGFTLFGGLVQFRWKGFTPLFYYSKASRDAVLKKDGTPNFYYVGTYVPKDYRDRFKEEVLGVSLRYNPPEPLPIGTQFALNLLQIRPDVPIDPDFSQLDIPGDRDSLKGDPSFLWISKENKRFFGFDFRTVIFPIAIEGEWAKEVGGGTALVLKGRYQTDITYLDVLFRHYDVDYTNPYMRPFQEDGRFEDTPIEREYRLLNPLDSELSRFPMPKPETGLYIETRIHFLPKWLIPRLYLDIWRDNTEGLWNYRFQGEIEFRPVFPVRIRFREKLQRRLNGRGLQVTRSLLDERNFRIYFLLPGRNFVGLESRYSKVYLTSRSSYPESEIRGGFVALRLDHSLTDRLTVKFGAIVWKTGGLSQWAFEDTGIDFFYGDGTKYFLTLLERMSPRLSLKLKFRYKETIFPHWGISENEAHTADGKPVYGFEEREPLYSLIFVLDYAF
jgi:hypothetical protein